MTAKDVELIMFLHKYKFLAIEDLKYLYDTKFYYKRQIDKLIKNNTIRKTGDNYLVLSRGAITYLKFAEFDYKKIRYEEPFVTRQKIISNIAAVFYKNDNVEFIPSTEVKR